MRHVTPLLGFEADGHIQYLHWSLGWSIGSRSIRIAGSKAKANHSPLSESGMNRAYEPTGRNRRQFRDGPRFGLKGGRGRRNRDAGTTVLIRSHIPRSRRSDAIG